MMLQISFKIDGWVDYLYWQSQDRKTLKKINSLIIDIARNPFEGIGKPEPLKGDLSGFWSRRIDDQNRIVYRVTNDSIVISSCKSHYE
jgi:toxin YoeB